MTIRAIKKDKTEKQERMSRISIKEITNIWQFLAFALTHPALWISLVGTAVVLILVLSLKIRVSDGKIQGGIDSSKLLQKSITEQSQMKENRDAGKK